MGPPVTIATALLFYFGWAVTAEQSRAMGLDESIFAMSTQDYVLRSLSALFVPLISAAAVLLAWVVLHGWLVDLLNEPPVPAWVRDLSKVLAWSSWWLLPAAGGAVAWLSPAWGELVIPLAFALGFLLTDYGVRLGQLASDTQGGPRTRRPRWIRGFRTTATAVLVTAALFWEVANFAGAVGRGKAEDVAASVNGYPTVKIYSQRDLQLDVPGITTLAYAATGSDYRFSYSGLHLLQRTGSRFFLVPPDWSPGDPLVVLRDDDAIRVEFTGSTTSRARPLGSGDDRAPGTH